MEVIALLTGRGGSKLKNKNLIKINNKRILDYPCRAAKKVKQISDFYVSSENKLILESANKNGFKKIIRPKKYSNSNSVHIDVLLHAIKFLKKIGKNPNVIVVLLANSPTIKSEWIEKSINILKKDKNISSVLPVRKVNDFHPYRAKKIVNGFLKPFVKVKKNVSTNRQDLESNYFLCHNFWTIRISSILKNSGYPPWKFMGKKCKPFIVENSIDIHDIKDFHLAKYILKNDY